MAITKVCTQCKLEKSVNEFYKDITQKSWYCPCCKMCKSIKAKELRLKYTMLETREKKDSKVCSCCKQEKNVSEYVKHRSCRDGLDNECKKCKYKYNHAYSKARMQTDPEFKLLKSMRGRLWEALKGKSKSKTTQQLIGVDIEIFTKWIDFQLEEGMTMKNYGTIWHIDHVIPLASFNLLDEDELQKAMNWKNIRPLTPVRNMQKSNKVDQWLYVMQEVKAHYFLKHLEEL